MAQLSDDCFAFGGPLLSVEAALARFDAHVPVVVATGTVSPGDADGRVLAADVVAPVSLPPFDNSAVDGYAVRHADLRPDTPTALPIDGRVAAGARDVAALRPGTARRILTGAPMPAGADTVFMQEDVTAEAGRVVLPPGLRRGANARSSGEDVARGAVALPAGRRLRPQDAALAAALGLTALPIRDRVRVGVFSTGDEVAEAGAPLRPGQIYDANRVLVTILARRAGATVRDLGILPDERDATAEALCGAARDCDLLVTTGGVSTGDEDHVKPALEAAGGQLVQWRLAVKPGRPVAMGVVNGTPLVGLPGNPVAVFVTFAVLARPLLARLGGETWIRPMGLPVRSGFGYRKKAGRREYVRVRLERGEGHYVARKHSQDGAGILSSLTETDGLIELPEAVTHVDLGNEVDFLAYTALL